MAPLHRSVGASYGSRAPMAVHPLSDYLLRLMEVKKSNLCLSADVSTARDLVSLADKLGRFIVVLKTHHDMVAGWDFHPQTGTGAKLGALARRHGFLIFEDRKFGDIGNTVEMQYVGGSARIIDWAHIVNLNMVPGKASVACLAQAAARWLERYPYEVRTSVSAGTPTLDPADDLDPEAAPGQDAVHEIKPVAAPPADEGRKGSIVSVTTVTQQYEPASSPRLSKNLVVGDADALFPGIEEAPMARGLLILAQMSTQGNFMTADYTQACVEAARDHKEFVMGFVAQENLNSEADDDFLHMTPGCQLPPEDEEMDGLEGGLVSGDGKGQQYRTPQHIIGICGADIAIVGRGILKASYPEGEAERYQRAAWQAYSERLR